MNILLVVLIVGVVAIIAIFVSSRYRNKDGYRRIFPNGAPLRRRRHAGETSDSAAFAAWSVTGGTNNVYPSSHDSYGPDCGPGHSGSDAGGGCSDGGGGGGADGGAGGH